MTAVLRALSRAVLEIAGLWYRLTDRRRRGSITWVVGVQEIAGVAYQYSRAIPGSYTVSFFPHPFYDHPFDYRWTGSARTLRFEKLVRRPIMLARLANRATGFLYIGHQGFLGPSRATEFAYLKRHGVRICCVFAGSDIRAPRRLEQVEHELGFVGFARRLRLIDGGTYFSDAYDAARRMAAEQADRYADVIFTVSVDQAGYLTRETEPFPYLLAEDAFVDRPAPGAVPVVLHAPSNPVLKGTDLVREAVETLHAEGLEFSYVELTGVPHTELLSTLGGADIVLNQFYAMVPGVFGLESMAAGCAVLQSADPAIEPDLAPGAEAAWLRTGPDEITAHLRTLLQDPTVRRRYADAGREWTRRWASFEAGSARLNTVLDLVVAGRYTGRVGWVDGQAGMGGSTR